MLVPISSGSDSANIRKKRRQKEGHDTAFNLAPVHLSGIPSDDGHYPTARHVPQPEIRIRLSDCQTCAVARNQDQIFIGCDNKQKLGSLDPTVKQKIKIKDL